MNESENNDVSGKNPQGNNLNQPQWPAGYPMPWPGYPAPPQAPHQADAQNYSPQGQGYIPWMPYPPYWMQPGFPSQPGTGSDPEAQSQGIPSGQEAPSPSGSAYPGYMPWPYAYPPQMMWGYPNPQSEAQEEPIQTGEEISEPDHQSELEPEPDLAAQPELRQILTEDSETQPAEASQMAAIENAAPEEYNNFRIQEETVPETSEPPLADETIDDQEEESTSSAEDNSVDVTEPEAEPEPEATPQFEAHSDSEERSFTIISESAPEISAPEQAPDTAADSVVADKESEQTINNQQPEQVTDNQEPERISVHEEPLVQSQDNSQEDSQGFIEQPLPPVERSGTEELARWAQQPIPPANPFITGVTSTPDPFPPHHGYQDAALPPVVPATPAPAPAATMPPQGVSRSLNAQVRQVTQDGQARKGNQGQKSTKQPNAAESNAVQLNASHPNAAQPAQPLLSDAPTQMPEAMRSTAASLPTPQPSDSAHYQQPTPEQLQKSTQPKGPAVPPIPPVPPFQPTSSSFTPQPEQAHEDTGKPFVMHLPDYLGVDKDIDETPASTEAQDSAQSIAAHITELPDAPLPVVGPDGVARIGHAASKLPSALTDPYDEKTGRILPADEPTANQPLSEPEKTNTWKIVLAIVLVIVLMVLGALLATKIGGGKDKPGAKAPDLSSAVNTLVLTGTNNVPEGLNVTSSHAGWGDNDYTNCYVDSQEDDSTLELVYAARRGDDAFTTLCSDTGRQRTLLSMAYRDSESSDPNNFVLLYAWDDSQSDDALGKVEYTNTDTEKNTKSEYRLDQDTLKIFTTSPATKSIRDSDLVKEVKFDTVWTRGA